MGVEGRARTLELDKRVWFKLTVTAQVCLPGGLWHPRRRAVTRTWSWGSEQAVRVPPGAAGGGAKGQEGWPDLAGLVGSRFAQTVRGTLWDSMPNLYDTVR